MNNFFAHFLAGTALVVFFLHLDQTFESSVSFFGSGLGGFDVEELMKVLFEALDSTVKFGYFYRSSICFKDFEFTFLESGLDSVHCDLLCGAALLRHLDSEVWSVGNGVSLLVFFFVDVSLFDELVAVRVNAESDDGFDQEAVKFLLLLLAEDDFFEVCVNEG